MEFLKRIGNRHKKHFFRTILTVLMLSIISVAMPRPEASASQVTLAWDPPETFADGSPVTTINGYKVFTGTAPGSYSQTENVGNLTSWTVTNLADGATYYFAVTAYDNAGNESNFSNEISTTIASAPLTWTLTATAGSGGSIVPQGNVTANQATNSSSTITTVSVGQGGNQSFSIIPNAGYRITSVTVDGVSVGAVSSYTFNSVSADHTISASFALAATYAVTASVGTGGTISPAGTSTVNLGATLTYTITPTTGYKVSDVLVDGVSVGPISTYSFSNVTANHSIKASFVSAATAGTVVFANNCGGTLFKDSTGISYQVDSKFTGGSAGKTTTAINGTVDDTLYKTWRSGTLSYDIPLTNGNYSVTLKFADNVSSTGMRVFDVLMEGTKVVSNLDILAKVGKNTAYDVTVPVTVTDGTLNINFANIIGYAKINAIVVKTR